ncbi:putative methyltransferase NSUN7 isoform X2 [Oscarella lobularis]|uniref:putative methyltransferase NSUN7 isoform X2 n=1 Tax=Oscarella lobularis TaxID=121494 RepID=UPI0033130DC3
MENGTTTSSVASPYSLYVHASKILHYLASGTKSDSPPLLPHELSSPNHRRGVYDLAYNAYRYRDILEEILEESDFFFRFFDLRDNAKLLLVILYDFQRRHFPSRRPSFSTTRRPFDVTADVEEIVDALHVHRVKLSAALARARVKTNSLDMTGMLRFIERGAVSLSTRQPLCARVNSLRIDAYEVVQRLKEQGWNLAMKRELEMGEIRLDPVVDDLLLFSPSAKSSMLQENPLFTDGMLVLEDHVDALVAASLGTLIADAGNVILTPAPSEGLVSHVATMITGRKRIVYVVNAEPRRQEAIEEGLRLQGINNVKFVSDSLAHANPSQFKNVKLIVVAPPSTNSCVINPVDHLAIHGDIDLDSIPSSAESCESRLPKFSAEQQNHLMSALRFPEVEAVAYFVRSHNHAETELVVTSALDRVKRPDVAVEEDPSQPSRPFQVYYSDVMYSLRDMQQGTELDDGPSLKLPSAETKSDTSTGNKCLQVDPSNMCNGFSLAILRRKPKAVRVPTPAREVLRRATVQGLLDMKYANGEQESSAPPKKKSTKKRSVKRRPSTLMKLTQAARNRIAQSSARQKSATTTTSATKDPKMSA